MNNPAIYKIVQREVTQLGCIVAQKLQRSLEGAAQLSGVQPSSVVYSVAQSVHNSSEVYSLAHRGAAKITSVQPQRSFLEYRARNYGPSFHENSQNARFV
jgi:hypothetical protein